MEQVSTNQCHIQVTFSIQLQGATKSIVIIVLTNDLVGILDEKPVSRGIPNDILDVKIKHAVTLII